MSVRPTPNYAFITACSNLQIIGLVLALHDYRALGAALMAIPGAVLFQQSWREHTRRNR